MRKQDPKAAAKLQRLMIASDVIYQADLAGLAQASTKLHQLESQIAELRDQLKAPLCGEIEPQLFHITAKHRVWIERCFRELNIQNARAVADCDVAKSKLALSSGRKEVLAGLLKKMAKSSAV